MDQFEWPTTFSMVTRPVAVAVRIVERFTSAATLESLTRAYRLPKGLAKYTPTGYNQVN